MDTQKKKLVIKLPKKKNAIIPPKKEPPGIKAKMKMLDQCI